MTDERLISIILPIYNQADHLEAAVREIRGELERLVGAYEMILVVNGCRDRSPEISRALAEELPEVRTLESAAGWGEAVAAGLAAARGEILCYTNLARTKAQDLLLLLLYATAYPDVAVKANRKVRDSLFRRCGSLFYNLECRMLFDLSQWDINGTPKVFPRNFSRLLELSRSDDLIDLEWNVVCRRQGYRMIEVPILSSRRHGGRSTTGLRSAAKLIFGALRMKRRWGEDA